MDLAVLEQTSEQFLGQWKRLVSTTNWEKGQIIFRWRSALIAAGAGVSEYADEVWSRQVGQITPQHVGRLRRVFERFGEVREDYPGLYWSHFQAALDWDDAEMWLEGAVQSSWSIADMRAKRAETLGTSNDPLAAAELDSEWDEDAEPADEALRPVGPSLDLVRSHAGPDQRAGNAEADGDEADDEHARSSRQEWDEALPDDPPAGNGAPAEPLRPFAQLASLPADVGEAFEAMKLCIIKHRLAGWVEIAQDDMLAALNALRSLALVEATS